MTKRKLSTGFAALLAAVLLITIPACADTSSAFGMGRALLVPVDMDCLLPSDGLIVSIPSEGAFGHSVDELNDLIRSGLPEARVLSVSPAGNMALVSVVAEDEEFLLACSGGTATLIWPGWTVPELEGLEDNDGRPAGEAWFSLTYRGFSDANRLDSAGIIWSADGRYFCPLSRWAMQNQLAARMETVWINQGTYNAMFKVYNPAYVMDVYYVVDTVTGQAAAVDFFRPADESSVMWLDACFSPNGELVVLGYGNVFGGEPAGAVLRVYDSYGFGKKKEITGMPDGRLPAEIMPEGVRMIPSMAEVPEGPESGRQDSRYFGITGRWQGIPQRLLWFGPDGAEGAGADATAFLEEISTPAKTVETSPVSGYSLVLAETEESINDPGNGLASGLLRVRAAEWNREEWNTLWVIPEGGTRLVPMTAEEVKAVREDNRAVYAAMRKSMRSGRNTQAAGTLQRYLNIKEVEFSPDGEYAIVLAVSPAMRRDEPADATALLVRIRDMECVPIEGLEFGTGAEVQEYLNGLDQYMQWTEAGILVTAGENRLYRLEEPGL